MRILNAKLPPKPKLCKLKTMRITTTTTNKNTIPTRTHRKKRRGEKMATIAHNHVTRACAPVTNDNTHHYYHHHHHHHCHFIRYCSAPLPNAYYCKPTRPPPQQSTNKKKTETPFKPAHHHSELSLLSPPPPSTAYSLTLFLSVSLSRSVFSSV